MSKGRGKMNRGLLTKLVVGITFSIAGIFALSECYGASVPITKTPLYKHLMKMYKTKESGKQESEKQQEKPQVKTEAPADKARESSNELTEEPVHKLEKKPARKQTLVSAPSKAPGLSALHPDMTFREAIDVFRNSTEPPLNIIVLWKDIEANSDVDGYTTIGMEFISGVPLGKHLELMLMAVSSNPGSLCYIAEKGTIIVGTRDSLRHKKETRVYDITDLLSRPANYFSPLRAPVYYGGANGGYGRRSYGGYGGARMHGGFVSRLP